MKFVRLFVIFLEIYHLIHADLHTFLCETSSFLLSHSLRKFIVGPLDCHCIVCNNFSILIYGVALNSTFNLLEAAMYLRGLGTDTHMIHLL